MQNKCYDRRSARRFNWKSRSSSMNDGDCGCLLVAIIDGNSIFFQGESVPSSGSMSGGLLAVARVVVTSLYNSCLMSEDECQILSLLAEIIALQVRDCSTRRRRLVFHDNFSRFCILLREKRSKGIINYIETHINDLSGRGHYKK